MWSYPNMIPLSPPAILEIWKAVKSFEFETMHGGFLGQDVRGKELKGRVLESMKIFVRGAGFEDAEVLGENLEN
jgi:hypothetical protein